MGRVEQYRAELRQLTEWEAYLKKNSGLPGTRANLELVEAVGDEADPERLWRLSASSDEFLAMCGTAGLGHLAVSGPVAWVMQGNLAKARMAALGPSWVAKWRGKSQIAAPAQATAPVDVPAPANATATVKEAPLGNTKKPAAKRARKP